MPTAQIYTRSLSAAWWKPTTQRIRTRWRRRASRGGPDAARWLGVAALPQGGESQRGKL